MRKCLSVLVFFLLFVTSLANASVVSHLNVARVSVDSSSAAARQKALPSALGQVLVKVSGNPAVMTLPEVQNAMDNVDGMIQSYGYLQEDQPDGSSHLVLQVTFDKKAVRQLLQQAGQATWSSNRPLTLAWVKIQANGETQVVSNTDDSQLQKVIQTAAKHRGVPILLPAMDLTDQNYMGATAEDFDPAALQKVEQRYAANAVLAGDVQQAGRSFQARWLLIVNGSPYRWQNGASSLPQLLQRAVNDAANLMANQLAVSDDKNLQSNVILEVSNVMGLNDYAKVIARLRHLTPVVSVSVKDMNDSDLILQVNTVGGAQALAKAMENQKHFATMESAENDNDNVDLSYRWVSAQPQDESNAP